MSNIFRNYIAIWKSAFGRDKRRLHPFPDDQVGMKRLIIACSLVPVVFAIGILSLGDLTAMVGYFMQEGSLPMFIYPESTIALAALFLIGVGLVYPVALDESRKLTGGVRYVEQCIRDGKPILQTRVEDPQYIKDLAAAWNNRLTVGQQG